MSIYLNQTEADALLAMPKRPAEEEVYDFPLRGKQLHIPLESLDRSEDFLIDVTRSRIDLSKITYQSRGRMVVVLMRLDLNGPPHRNPDDTLIICPHLHIYREGFGDKWAFSVPHDRYSDLSNMSQTLSDFLRTATSPNTPKFKQQCSNAQRYQKFDGPIQHLASPE